MMSLLSMANELEIIAVAAIVVLGVGGQWLAWRLRVPSILVLLLLGFLVGPVSRWISTRMGFDAPFSLDPDVIFGELLTPIVSLSVGLILFEGGMTLRISQLTNVKKVVRDLVTLGAAVTWLFSAVAAHYLIGLDWKLSILLGAILVVTGPTVIGPLLRHVKPVGQVGPVLKWEGIVIDPIGAGLTVLVFEAISGGGLREATPLIIWGVVKTLAVGVSIGCLAAGLVILMLRRFWVPDYLQSATVLAIVVAAFTGSNILMVESGLFTVTVMGIVLANQHWAKTHHILEFKETLSVLLIGSLFILLSSRLRLEDVAQIGPMGLVFLLVLIVIVRPLAVVVSTARSAMTWNERAFLACMAPRGIVAASISSVFALRLSTEGFMQAHLLVPLTFLVIVGTVLVYGLGAPFVARWLGLAQPGTGGFLIAGASPVVRAIAKALQNEKYEVLLVDTNHSHVQAARLEGLPAVAATILSPEVADRVALSSVSRLLALTPNDEVNTLAATHFGRIFGRGAVYQLPSAGEDTKQREKISGELHGRVLFDKSATYSELARRWDGGARVKSTKLTKEFDFDAMKKHYPNGTMLPLFVVSDSTRELSIFTRESPPTPKSGQTVISLAAPQKAPATATTTNGESPADAIVA